MPTAPTAPPSLLQIYREPLKPGCEAAYRAIEEDTARTVSTLGCPHPYLGVESLTGPKEVWWFNGYESPAEQQQVVDEYAGNTRLMTALQENSRKKASLTLAPMQLLARYRPEWSTGVPWLLGRGRFLVITRSTGHDRCMGTVFEAADGTCVIVAPAENRQEAESMSGLSAQPYSIFAVRPSWSVPADDWVAADRAFWKAIQQE
ncbi:MAG: hypothetical protein ACRD2I_23140 [Vicinamibacterales bacterium]